MFVSNSKWYVLVSFSTVYYLIKVKKLNTVRFCVLFYTTRTYRMLLYFFIGFTYIYLYIFTYRMLLHFRYSFTLDTKL